MATRTMTHNPPSTHHSFEFRGQGSEYFGIWVTNTLFTILTLGIYSAWAKVRRERYFYGNAWVAGHNFDFTALPKQILLGRLVVGAFFIAYYFGNQVHPELSGLLLLALFLVSPWIIWRALRFRAAYSTYRTVRFGFVGSLKQAFVAYVLMPIVSTLTLFLGYPWQVLYAQRYQVDHHRYGHLAFRLSLSVKPVLGRWLQVLGLGLLMLLGLGYWLGPQVLAFFLSLDPETQQPLVEPPPMLFAIPFLMIMSFFFLRAHWVAGFTNLTWNHTTLGADVHFRSELRTWPLFWIYSSNFLMIALSFTLASPWASVRLAKYRAKCLTMQASSEQLEAVINQQRAQHAAFGDAASDLFDVDIGGI